LEGSTFKAKTDKRVSEHSSQAIIPPLWCVSVIPAMQEVQVRGSFLKLAPGKNVRHYPKNPKKPKAKRAGVKHLPSKCKALNKPQYHKTNKKPSHLT
jgi:hypothetical protein